MTVSNDVNKAGPYVGDDSNKTFSFTTIKVFDDDDLTVIKIASDGSEATLVRGTDYSVSRNYDQDASPGGSITYPLDVNVDELSTDEYIIIFREIDEKQESDITNLGGFYPDIIENMADRAMMVGQQNEERGLRSLRMSRGATTAQIASMELAASSRSKNLTIGLTGLLELSEVLASGTISRSVIGSYLYPITTAETTAGSIPTDYSYPAGDFRRYGAVSGADDNYLAIQAAVNAAQAGDGKVLIPPGYWRTKTAIENFGGCDIEGVGSEGPCQINPIGCHAFLVENETSAQAGRFHMRNFAIVGDDSSAWDGIHYSDTNTWPMYRTRIENLIINDMGGCGIRSENDFSCYLGNVRISDCGENLFELEGGASTVLENCYAGVVSAGYYGYRVRGMVTLIACNGVDAGGGNWGLFGDDTGGSEMFGRVLLQGCNIEDFDDIGIEHRYSGVLQLKNCTFFAKGAGLGTFSYYIKDTANPGFATLIQEGTTYQTKGAAIDNGTPNNVPVWCNRALFIGRDTIQTTNDGVNEYENACIDSVNATSGDYATYLNRVRIGKIDGNISLITTVVTATTQNLGLNAGIFNVRTDTGDPKTINLYESTSDRAGNIHYINDYKGNASVKNITINAHDDGDGTDKINGANFFTVNTDYDIVMLICNGDGTWTAK